MGNTLAFAGSPDAEQDDRRYLGLSGSALFQDSFVAQEYERLPAFEGTELPAASAEDEEAGRKDGQGASSVEDGKTRRLLEILVEGDGGAAGSLTASTPAAAVRVEDGRGAGRGAAILSRMRSRMLQRIHLAILRESDRVHQAASSEEGRQQQGSGDGRDGSGQDLLPALLGGLEEEEDDDGGGGGMAGVDGPAVLNMASMRVSLAVLKAVGGSNPEVFVEFCQSMLGLFQACPAPAFAQIQRHRAQRETLEQIRDFAFSVVRRPAPTAGARRERDHALALLFGLGVARGSVHDLVEVAALLASEAWEDEGGKGEEGNDDGTAPPLLLSRIPAVRPFWEWLTTYEHHYQLGMINPFEPDGPEILIEAGSGGGAPATDPNGATTSAGAAAGATALACDGAYLYIWHGARGTLEKVGTGRKGTVAGKVYLRRADVLRVATMLPVFVGGLRRRSGLQPPEAEVDGNGCSSDDVRAMVRIRRRSSVRDDPDVAAAVRATLAAGEEHEVIEEEMGPANQRWVRVRAGWLLDGAGGGGGDEEEEEAEESKEEEEGGSAAAADLSQSIATSGFPDISSLGGLGAPTSASAAAAAATCPTSPLARPSAPVPGLSPSRPGSATTETAAAAPAEADAAAALEFFHIPADTRPGAKPGAASPAAGEAGEGAEGAWLAHIDGKLFFKCTPQMAPFDMAILSAATLRVERVFRLLLFGCVEEEDDEDDDAAAPAPAQAAEEQDGGGPRPGLDGPAAVEPAAAVGEPTTVEHATVHAGVRVRAEDAHVTQMAGILHGSQLGLAPPAEQRVLMDAGEASDGWRGFPLPAAEAPETTALRTLTLDLGEPRVLTRLGAVFHVGPGARLVLVFLFVSPDGRDFQAWPDPASPATSPQGENPESPYFVAARAPVFARFVRFSFALDHGGEGMWVQRLHAQGPPQAAAEVGGSAVAASHGAAAPASSPRTPAPVIPGFTTDGRGLYVVYGTPNDDTGVATVDPEADGAAGTTLHVCGWDPGTYCVDGGHFSVRASAEDRPLLLLKGLFTNGHQLLVLSGDSARTTAARGSAPTYTAAAYGISRWRWAEMEITKPEQCRFVFEGGSSSSGGLPAATPSFLPQAFAYDAHNNVVWGAELFAEGGGKVASWSNVGNLAPPIYPPEMDNLNDWELSLVPEKRRETLLYLATRAEGERDAQEDRVSSSAAAQLQAAIILSCLDHCAEPYGAAGGGGLGLGSPAAGPSLAPLSAADHGSQELVVSAAGKEEGLSQRRARFVVQGRALTSCAPGAAFERGLNLVRLDAGYEPVETRGFDTTGRSGAGTVYNDLLLEYVSRLPEGTVVLVASQEDAGRGLTPTGQEALQMLGGDGALVAGLRAAPNDSSYALIGRKGARHTSARVVQRLGRRGGHASVRLRLSVVPVPLCVEPSSPTLRALVRVVLAHKDAALAAGPCTLTEKCRAGHVLSALSLLTTNIHVLMRACPPAAAATVAAQQLRGLFDPEELYDLQDFLLEVLGAPPTPPTLLGPHLGEAALRLFVTALDIFHPTPSGQCALLTQLMGRYAEGALSLLEASVLGLLLKRIANPSSLLALMLNPGAGLCLDLFRTILAIAEGESTAALAKLSTASIAARTLRAAAPSAELASHGIGHAALTMLASLTNKLLCLTAHGALFASKTIAASKGKDIGVSYTAQSIHGDSIAALLHVVGALGTSCQTLLDAALAVLEEQQEQEEEGEGGGVDGRDAASAATARMERALSRASSLSLSPSRSGLARASSTASLSSKGGGHGQPQRWRDLEAALQASPFGALLPLLVLVVTELARYEVPALLPALRRLVLALSSLAQRVHRLVAYLPASAAAAAGTRVAAVGGCTTRQQVFESAHPYLPNTDQTFTVHFPKAARIVIEFDPQTRTETDYDFMRFFKDVGRTQSWHPEIEKFSGRSGNETWPGFGNRPPLIIEGDLAYCYFHSDSSNEDWGFRFTATAYYTATATYEDAHWLLLLERHLNACIAALVGGLVASVPWQGELEARNRRWVEGPDAILGDGCAPRQEEATAAETSLQSSFLSSLITRPPGSPAAALVAAMRRLVAEDRGRHPSVDRAVYAGVAALLHHNGLVGEAMALAERAAAGECDGGGGGALEGAVASPSLLRAWRAGAKMRHFFALADVRAGLQGPSGQQQQQQQQQQQPPPPSLYDGAEDAVVDAAAAEVVERARFLMTLAPAASFSPSRRARVRSQHQAPAAAPATAPGGAGDKEGQWAAVVQELHASSPSIMEVFAQRRAEAQREQLARLCSTTERVLRFLQTTVHVEELKALHKTRIKRALFRAEGLELLTELLAQTPALPMQVDLLVGFMRGLRQMPQEVADGGAPCPSAMIHVRAGLSGCLSESAQAVGAAYSQFLRALVQILRESLPFLHPGAAGGAAAEARQRLALAALKACTLDHGAFADHAVLDASGLLPTLEGYLAVPDPTLRAAVWALLESLLDRAGPEPAAAALAAHHHDADAAERFHGQLLGLMFRLLGRTAGAGSAGGGRSVAASDTRWALSRATVGPVIPYARLTLGTTFAFWLFRPAAASGSGPGGREQAGRQPKLLKPGDRIVRGPDWCDGEENGWVGAVGTVRMMETPTAVIVEWDGMREDQFIYRWGAVVDGRKVYDLEIVRDQGAGGLLLFKGTESLAGAATTTTTPADGEQEDDAPAEPWSALGLSLTETFRLLFRTCTAGEGLRAPTTFAVLTNRPLPCGEWVHVACDISQKSVVLYVNGEVDAEKPLPPSLLYQRAGSAASGADTAPTPIEDFNPSPIFVGQPPSYATGEKGAEGLLQELTIARRSLSAEEIKGLAAQRPPVEPEASSTATAEESKDGHLLDAISLTRKCLRSLPMDTVRGAVDPAVVQSVLGLVVGDASASAWGLPVRVAATRLAAALLPFVDDKTLSQVQLPGAPAPPKTSNSSSLAGLGPVDGHFKGKRAALVALVLEAAGAFLVAPHVLGAAGASAADSTVLESVESAESRAGLAHQRLALLRSLALAWSKGWADAVVEVVAQVLVDLPELLAQLGTGATTEDAAAEDGSIEGALARPLAMAAAVLALLGGDAEGLAVGADVLVKAAERKGCAEEGVVLALAHAEGDKDQAPRGLGGAVVVALRSDPTRPQVLPRERVTPQPCRDQAAFLRLFIGEQAGLDTMLASFRCLVGHELRGGSPHLYAPKLVEEVQTHVVESPHPHERGADLQVPLRFPGAKSIDVVFDEQSRTAWGKAHVQFLKEEDSLEWFGKEKYQGRDREQCWAGAHGAPKLVIPAASCVVRFVSDGHEEPDWGFKLTARAHTVREVAPPELPPSGRYAARAQLCMQGTKALTAVLQTAPPLGQPAAAAGLLRALVGSALAGNDGASGSSSSSSQARGRYRRRATPLELESGHPYSNNEERFEEVAFPGAKRLVVRFDPRSSTEKGCDFVRFYKDESRSAYWGVAQYTGSKDGSAALWPGVGACPPLVISSDRCVLYFHSDGSVVDWGFRCWVMPDYRDLDGLENMGLAEVGARVFTLHQCLCDGAKPQTVPAGVAWFRRLPSGALPSAVRSITTTGPDGGEEDEEALAALCGGLSVGEAASASTDTGEPQDEDAAVLALAKAQSRAKVVGRRFVVNRHDAGTVTVRAAPHPVAPMVGMLDDCDQPVLALEERGEWMRIDWWALPTPAVAWVQRRRSDHILMVPVDEVGGGQDALLVLPNEELEDDDAGVQPGRANSMYECADVALVDTAAVASASASTARSDGENLHPAECVHGQQARLRSALTELQLHAARGYAKRSVTALLLQWPETEPLDLGTAFGSPQVFLRFLATAFQDEQQRAVAAAASAGGGGGVPGAGEDSPLLQVLRRTIRQVLADEREGGRGDGDGAAFARTLLAYPLRQLREAAGLYASVTPTRGLVKPFQTPHPYPNNADLSWKVSFPGASRLKLVWDARSSTEPNCDYFVLYRDADHSDDNRVSPVHYSGRVNDMEASWPGVGGRPPLYVDSDHVDIVFRSDASNNDWGAKIYVYGLFKEPSAEELAAFRAKKKVLRPRLALACWLLGVLAAEPLLPLAARVLYAPPTLAAVTEYIARVGPRERVWMVQLACSLLSHLHQPPVHLRLPPRSVGELRRLVAVLQSQAHAQITLEAVAEGVVSPHDAEDSGSEEEADARRQRERQEGHHKSQLLQTLIQATMLGEACPLLFPSSSPSPSSPPSASHQQPLAHSDASAMDLWLGTIPAATRELAMPGSADTAALRAGESNGTPWASSGASGCIPSGTGTSTLRKLRAAVDSMRAFVDRTVPAEAVRRFLDEEVQRLRVVYECSALPSSDGDDDDDDDGPLQLLAERVCIPGAVALEVRVDGTTRLGPRDTIRVAEDDAEGAAAGTAVELRGMDRGSDPQGAELYGLCVGDLVVRGPGWCWGSEDGGPGGGAVGEVIELRAWKGRPATGARVRWRNGRVGLYRWAYDGVFDVAYLKPGERSTRPIRVRGETLHLAVERLAAPPPPPEGKTEEEEEDEEKAVWVVVAAHLAAMEAVAEAAAAAYEEHQSRWRGALCFDGLRPIVAIPDFPAAELTGDFTIALWCRLDATVAPTGRSSTAFTLVSRALEGLDDGNGAPVHQLLLSVEPGSGQLVLSMQNQQMQTGVRFESGITVQRTHWTHVAVTVRGQRVQLCVSGANGICVSDAKSLKFAFGRFDGQRLTSLGAPLCVGAVQGQDDSHWSGHLWGFRLYDRALSVVEVRMLAKEEAIGSGSSDPRAEGLVCHLLTAPDGVVPRVPAPRMARNAVGDGGGQGAAEVQDCMWDDDVEPLAVLAAADLPAAAAATAAVDDMASLLQPSAQQPAGTWSYRITVLPVFPPDPAAIAQIPLLAERFAAFAAPYTSGSFKLDLALARHVNRTAQQRRWGVEELLACRRFEEVAPEEEDLVRLPLLRQLVTAPAADAAAAAAAEQPGGGVAACRFAMLQELNRAVREVVLLIDLSSIDRPWSVAHLLSRCRGLVYHSVKAPCWRKALAATACVGTVAELHLSRSRAAKLRASGLVDHDARATVFGQAYRALHGLPPRGFRRADKAWNVVWRGESSQDAGGPYREAWSVCSLELQSPALPLLHRTPNNVHAVGPNREHWVLNPGCTGELALQLFAFLGKLMGMVMRNGELLHLDLSPVVWKLLGGEPVAAPEDLEAVDVEIARSLRLLRAMGREEFDAAFADHLDFTCVATDGRTVELVPGGAQRTVGYGDRVEYARLVEQYRLREFDAQAAALRAGLATIVPARLLALFTWEEIEVMVCGLRQVDVGLLRQVTEYSFGVRPEDPHVQYLWQVLEEWTDEERSMFIRFCWGRSRLPLRAEDFPQRFKIQCFGRAPADQYLPVAHTCFFSLELPVYSSLEVCRRKLTLAISACSEIDADENAIGAQAAAMGWED